MPRKFTTVNYNESLKQTVTPGDVLPTDHLARFIVGLIPLLDLSAIYARYAPVGGMPVAPAVLLGLLFYGYATGVFSSRKIERATHEAIPFRFIAGGLRPDHDTIAHFRKTFLPEITALFAQVLLVAHELGYVKLGNISVDGVVYPFRLKFAAGGLSGKIAVSILRLKGNPSPCPTSFCLNAALLTVGRCFCKKSMTPRRFWIS